MSQLFFNLQPFAPLLEKDLEPEKPEFLERLRSSMDEKKTRDRAVLSIVRGIQFFGIIKDRFGQVFFY